VKFCRKGCHSGLLQWRFWGLHFLGEGSRVAIIAAGGHGPILPQ